MSESLTFSIIYKCNYDKQESKKKTNWMYNLQQNNTTKIMVPNGVEYYKYRNIVCLLSLVLY